jgi:hypothetical protein
LCEQLRKALGFPKKAEIVAVTILLSILYGDGRERQCRDVR